MVALTDPVVLLSGASLAAVPPILALIAYLQRHRGRPGVTWFIATLVAQAVWCLAYGLGVHVAALEVRVALELLILLAMVWLVYTFLGFAFEYTGYGVPKHSRLFHTLGIVPAVASVLFLTAPFHDLLWTDLHVVSAFGTVGLQYTFTVWGLAAIGISLLYGLLAILLLIDTIRSYGPLYRYESLAVAVSTLPLITGVLVWLFGPGELSAVHWGAVLSLPHIALDAYAFVGKNMFETNPTTRRVADAQAIDTVPDPVLILDPDGRLIDFNDAAANIFVDVSRDVIGHVADDVLDTDLRAVTGDDPYLHVTTDDRHYEFAVQHSPLVTAGGMQVGSTMLFRDITDEREREQRLQVFNRVLRHNLRNELTTIGGSASMIAERSDDEEVRELATMIRRAGESLAAIGEKARRFDRLQQAPFTPVRIDVAALVDEVTATFADRARFETHVETDVVTDRAHLQFVLENLVENAVEHTDDPNPRVEIGVELADRDDYATVIAVSDDGPGIPQSEIDVLTRGAESDLAHGSGIGLWTVAWCLTRIGGDVTFECDQTGTTVRLWLPASATEKPAGS
ncbi:histidine kinase N-terminal 7TM domain-containing protein [Halarchaeum sp. P4]|uniref:histidine kinase N-terminal 7TM domain-containing protein n=1 Tax=Halarchaeum sp. P4 TaxID=3421639 RepID=UPI003EBCB503